MMSPKGAGTLLMSLAGQWSVVVQSQVSGIKNVVLKVHYFEFGLIYDF